MMTKSNKKRQSGDARRRGRNRRMNKSFSEWAGMPAIRTLIAMVLGLLMLITLQSSDSFLSPMQEIVILAVGLLVAIAILLGTRDYVLCALTYTFSLLIMVAFYLLTAYSNGRSLSFALSFERSFQIGLIWACGYIIMICFRLFSKGRWDTYKMRLSFKAGFHLSAAVFVPVYIVLLIMLFVSQRQVNMYESRSLNLIPFQGAFAIYWPELLGGNFRHGIFIQFFGNLLIFTPLGYFFSVYFSGVRRAIWIAFPIFLAGLIEFSQYALNTGKSDIDDFWMNVLGFYFGVGVVRLLGYIRYKVSSGKEKSILPK